MLQQIITTMPMFVCGVLALELVFSLWQSRGGAKVWLLLWAVAATVLYACHFVYFNNLTVWLPLTDSIYAFCNLSVFPLYLMFIYKMTDERPPSVRLTVVAVSYALLATVAGALVAVLYATMSPAELQVFFTQYLYAGDDSTLTGLPLVQAVVHDVCKGLFAVGVVASVVIGARRLKRYNALVDLLYADTDDKSLRGLTALLCWFLLTAAGSLVANFLGRQMFLTGQDGEFMWLLVPSLLFSVLLCAVGWMGMRQRFSIANIVSESAGQDEQPVDTGKLKEVASAFVRLMDNEQLFLQPDLRLDTVIRAMNTNRTYLLQALNVQLGMTFTEYVNRRRIEYACRLLARNPSMTHQEVAMACGYNVSSTFYRNYKTYAAKGLI